MFKIQYWVGINLLSIWNSILICYTVGTVFSLNWYSLISTLSSRLMIYQRVGYRTLTGMYASIFVFLELRTTSVPLNSFSSIGQIGLEFHSVLEKNYSNFLSFAWLGIGKICKPIDVTFSLNLFTQNEIIESTTTNTRPLFYSTFCFRWDEIGLQFRLRSVKFI